jgi:hypothetical protein
MTEISAGGITPARIQQAFTPRELGEWETTLGVPLANFGSSHMAAMLAWWAAKHDATDRGETAPHSVDEFLDFTLDALEPYLGRAVERLGEARTGDETPSGSAEPRS